jgi:hypothetical protein
MCAAQAQPESLEGQALASLSVSRPPKSATAGHLEGKMRGVRGRLPVANPDRLHVEATKQRTWALSPTKKEGTLNRQNQVSMNGIDCTDAHTPSLLLFINLGHSCSGYSCSLRLGARNGYMGVMVLNDKYSLDVRPSKLVTVEDEIRSVLCMVRVEEGMCAQHEPCDNSESRCQRVNVSWEGIT